MSKPFIGLYFVFPGSDGEMHDRSLPEGEGSVSSRELTRLKHVVVERERIDYHLLRDFEYDGTGAGAGGPAEFPQVVRDLLMIVGSSGITTALFHLLKNWTDNRNGRRIKLRVRDVEVEATQMTSEQFLEFFRVVRQLDHDEQARAALEQAGFEVTKK
jgi:hypothetical protein